MANERTQYLREWRLRNKEKVNAQSRAYVERNPEKRAESSSAWGKRNRAKRRAHGLLWYHLSKGHIQRQPCVDCGTAKSQAHHHDYSKALDVTWLCAACHGRRHRAA